MHKHLYSGHMVTMTVYHKPRCSKCSTYAFYLCFVINRYSFLNKESKYQNVFILFSVLESSLFKVLKVYAFKGTRLMSALYLLNNEL